MEQTLTVKEVNGSDQQVVSLEAIMNVETDGVEQGVNLRQDYAEGVNKQNKKTA